MNDESAAMKQSGGGMNRDQSHKGEIVLRAVDLGGQCIHSL